MSKTIEIFSAGCPLCEPTKALLEQATGSDCHVIVTCHACSGRSKHAANPTTLQRTVISLQNINCHSCDNDGWAGAEPVDARPGSRAKLDGS